ncbi:MAG: hypothetical protein MdMp014T_2838 [Treponematales bacterium]|jgi:hypothetical protein
MKKFVLLSLVFALAAGAAWSQRKIGSDGKILSSPFDGVTEETVKAAIGTYKKPPESPFDAVTNSTAKTAIEQSVTQKEVDNRKVARSGVAPSEQKAAYFDPSTLTPQAREVAMDLVYSASAEIEPTGFSNPSEFAAAVAAEYNRGEYYWLILKGTADKGTRERYEVRTVGVLKAYLWFHDDQVDAYLFSPYDFEVLGKTAVSNRYDVNSYEEWRRRVESNARTDGFTVYTRGIAVENRMTGYVVGQLGPVIFPKDFSKPRSAGENAGSIKLLQSTVLDYIRAETGWTDEEILNRTSYAIQGQEAE